MPNVTWFISSDDMPEATVLQAMTAECTEMCTGILKATLDNVHIIFLAVQPGRGHPVYVEIKYRLETFRPPEVMKEFIDALEESILRHSRLKARIRCFGFAQGAIFARN
jgi:hypothetical protein